MDHSQFTDISSFTIQGRLLCLYGKRSKKPKGLKIKTSRGKYHVCLSKALRKQGCPHLIVGEWVWVTGHLKSKKKRCILEATEVRAIAPEVSPSNSFQSAPPSADETQPTSKVLICQKSSCVKRGAKNVEKAVETVICDRGLTEDITIKPTGCMGHCKKGPNVVVMPGKQRYQKVKPSDAPKLIVQPQTEEAHLFSQ